MDHPYPTLSVPGTVVGKLTFRKRLPAVAPMLSLYILIRATLLLLPSPPAPFKTILPSLRPRQRSAWTRPGPSLMRSGASA